VTSTKLMTAEELEAMPDDGNTYELVRGALVLMSPAGGLHGRIESRLGRYMDIHVFENDLGAVFTGDTGFILARDPDTVRGLDIAFVRKDRLPADEEQEGFLALAPDLAVEVISPSDRMSDVLDKVAEYLDAGTRLVVLVVPRRKELMVYGADRSVRVLTVKDTFDGGDVLPGFRLPVAAIFA
jgi:Uma2 family endonuclease